MKPTLTVVISAFNEGKKLDRTLSSVSWADEIIVVEGTDSLHGNFLFEPRPNESLKKESESAGIDESAYSNPGYSMIFYAEYPAKQIPQ